MTQIENIFAEKQEALRDLCIRYAVARLELFGSATSPAFDPAKSDLDFLVDFNPPPPDMDLVEQYFGFRERLEGLFGRHIDLVERSAIRKPRFLQAIENQRKLLYAA